ncbi:MAG TPA: enoyl-CoA hydratase/isomerase family protein [Sandaracinaceae bacterium]
MGDVVRSEAIGGAWVLTVDREETRNAIDPAVHDALSAAIDRVEQDRHARAVILTGAGASFVSGGDLKLIRERPFEETLALSRRMNALLDRLEGLRVPVIAAINGWALGGGLEVALACDHRIADAGAKLAFRQAAMGVTTGWGAATRLARIVPRGAAVRLLATAEVIDASRAEALGLVDEVAPPGQSVARALELARAIAECSPRAVAAFKEVLRAAYGGDAERSRAVEWDAFCGLWGGEDHREALDAFFAKRKPKWR